MRASDRDAEFNTGHSTVLEKYGHDHTVNHVRARVRRRSRGAEDDKDSREWERCK